MMTPQDQLHYQNLKAALIELAPSGPTGFEGLVAVVLADVLGQPLRLAKSGSQRGRDGDTAFDDGAIYFEAKRYGDPVRATEVKSKLIDIMNDEVSQLEMWVLAATCEVGSQLGQDVTKTAEKIGIISVILDWPDTALGMLPVAIASCAEKAKRFLDDNLDVAHAGLVAPAKAAIDHLKAHPDFEELHRTLRANLLSPEKRHQHAKVRNDAWMREALSNKIRANSAFRQVLTPLDASRLLPLQRKEEVRLANAFSGRPATDLYAVIGNEGVGKSWLAVQAWLSSERRSILTVVNSADLQFHEIFQDFDKWLVDRVIHQSGGASSDDRLKHFWKRRFAGWRANSSPENVRITLVLDGLNETGATDWPRLIDHIAFQIKELGGCLVLTTRLTHWSALSKSLLSSVTAVRVEPWTVDEVRTLLASSGIEIGDIAPVVLQSLRNPRILAIALALKASNHIEDFQELSVERLMFEHMRQARNNGTTHISGEEFAIVLRSLAEKVIARRQSQQRDDIEVFNIKEERDLAAVASSRFFEPIKTDHTRYSIKPDGLNIGLALWLIDRLEAEVRSGRSPADELSRILEPIDALDETADMLALASQIACLDPSVDPNVSAALVEHFVSMQNATEEGKRVFTALARQAPQAFADAAERAYTLDFQPRRVDELMQALLQYRDDPLVSDIINSSIEKWLSLISLNPERMMHRSMEREATPEAEAERAKQVEKLQLKVASLTTLEREFERDHLRPFPRTRYGRLHQAAFYLAAGGPLARYANAFARWAFADALSPSFDAPEKEFRQLIRFNPNDWAATHSALHVEIAKLADEATSKVGKWAKVELLRATGDVADAAVAEDLATWLTRDRPTFEDWSLLESYCAADPCDPNTSRPRNVLGTAVQYDELIADNLKTHAGQSAEDGFFEMARTGVARFVPNVAIKVHRAFAESILSRQGDDRRFAVLDLLPHSALLTPDQVSALLAAGQQETAGITDEPGESDAWLVAQQSIHIAIGHLTPDDQLEAVSKVRGKTILLDILQAMGKPSATKTQEMLELVQASGDNIAQSMVLGALQYTRPDLTPRSKEIIGQMLDAEHAVTRSNALGLIANSGDPELLRLVVESGWSATKLGEVKNGFERWFGSMALVSAATEGLVPAQEALSRIDIGQFGFAAAASAELATVVAELLDPVFAHSIEFEFPEELPELTLTTVSANDAKPPIYSVSARVENNDDGLSRLTISRSSEAYLDRQKRAYETFKAYFKKVVEADSGLLIAGMTLEGVEAVVNADPVRAAKWLGVLQAAVDPLVGKVQHFATLLAVALAARGSRDAADLVVRALNISSTFKQVEGHGTLQSLPAALWKRSPQPAVADICKNRLRRLALDAELSDEVALAHKYDSRAIVHDVIVELESTGHPADLCRAITLAGYCDVDPQPSAIIDRYADARGYVGVARKAAKNAYDRNAWAQTWFQRMQSANEPEAFWEASVQFLKIVDVRFEAWKQSSNAEGSAFRAFFPSVIPEMKSRINKFRTKRGKTLFGDKIPPDAFLGLK
ncbi:hypothetical protein QTL95_21565 [Rhizobium sp. S152]|uniref:hypothetical protein n=1 Tax=Rhizobium sp. S152 TaxID=3055038 RepID=UPI0025A9C02E|nr:hypothetical protein [Rhizobium sp. S152]MDM9628489.1 hypothetical protein [Rhizobium sp. S152]